MDKYPLLRPKVFLKEIKVFILTQALKSSALEQKRDHN